MTARLTIFISSKAIVTLRERGIRLLKKLSHSSCIFAVLFFCSLFLLLKQYCCGTICSKNPGGVVRTICRHFVFMNLHGRIVCKIYHNLTIKSQVELSRVFSLMIVSENVEMIFGGPALASPLKYG